MDLLGLEERNRTALEKVFEFRNSYHPEHFGKFDEAFHWHKNRYPYFNFIDIEIGDQTFLMFSGNDDIVAMGYFWHGPSSFEAYSTNLWASLVLDSQQVLDVGAFSGVYSLLAASANRDCRVVAFEPARRTYGRLLLNTVVNGLHGRISAKNVAVSNVVEQIRLLQFRGEYSLGSGASILEKEIPVTDGSEIIETVILDDFCHEEAIEPDLIKIDVEGAEVLALEGMENILSTYRPRCIVEVTPQTLMPVKNTLDRHDYKIALIDEKKMSLSTDIHGLSGVRNILATPKVHTKNDGSSHTSR